MKGELITPLPGEVLRIDLGTHHIAFSDLGSGAPIIFAHGGLMDHQSWGNQLPLADRYRLIMPDTRGHGRSGGAGLPATYAAFGDDIVGVMDALGLEQATLIGFSDGGCAALHVALNHPKRLRNLVLIGTPYSLESYNDGVVERFSAMVPEDMDAARPLVREVVAKMRVHMSDDEWSAYWQRIIRGLWPSEPNFVLADFAGLPVRTLILHGEHERSVSTRASEELAATIPDCRLVYVPGATHSAAQDEPDFVNESILRFLETGK
ncbi:alpha/beta hydrolase [Aquamicrobium sp. LC103]|uniref:alpha/beta fold hydrolase n=1 Tax=Aquamicrobium sp. LC103 TaxID=1120658 RepID=UPI00063E89C3|nr:alpha/beta hydrolase [Aquamicrobium sp. LC103]TKT78222.1 alpha/beta hydrolase [Aquamicrobium sp. LC103]